jgi:hypothetical protein
VDRQQTTATIVNDRFVFVFLPGWLGGFCGGGLDEGRPGNTLPERSGLDLRRLELRLLLGLFPCHAAKDECADRYRARQAMSGSVLVDDGEEFNWHPDFGCS